VNTITEINRHSHQYPVLLKSCSTQQVPDTLYALGNRDMLKQKTLAFFCSIKCPGTIILQTHDFIKSLNKGNLAVIGGFHSPIEQECLNILLRGKTSVIVCPARALHGMRIRREYKRPLEDGRLLLLSLFKENHSRMSLKILRLEILLLVL
jgi:predicted Rossmann fold nucleotide-binding protein DprA/Smf involved in DNA uptake